MGPLGMSAKQHREYLKLQSQEQREQAKMEKNESRKNQLHEIKLQEAAAKANQSIGHKEKVNAVKLKEMGSPLGKAPRMNKQKLGIPTQNPLAGTGMFRQGQRRLSDGTEDMNGDTDTIPAMLTPGEAVIPEPAAQDPKNKATIQRMVEEGREENALRDGAVKVVNSDSNYSNGTMSVPGYYDGTTYVDEFEAESQRLRNQPVPPVTIAPELLQAQRMVESGNRMKDSEGRYIVSPAGAIGISQLMPETAYNPGYGVPPLVGEDIYDEQKQISFQNNYMNAMSNKYEGDSAKALTAYNAGPGNVDKAIAKANKAGKPDEWKTYLPTKEAKEYADKVMANMSNKKEVPKDLVSQIPLDEPRTPVPTIPSADLIRSQELANDPTLSANDRAFFAQEVKRLSGESFKPVGAATPQERAKQLTGDTVRVPEVIPEPVASTEVPAPEVPKAPVAPSLLETKPQEANKIVAETGQNKADIIKGFIDNPGFNTASTEEKKSSLEKFISSIFGPTGVFSDAELARFAVVAAGGLLTGGSVGGSLKYAGIDALKSADARRASQATRANEELKNTRELGERLDSDYRNALGENVPAAIRARAVELYQDAKTPDQKRAVIQLLKMNKSTEDTMGTGKPTAPNKGFFDGKPIDFRTQAGNVQRVNAKGEWENIPPSELKRFETEEARTKNTKQMIDSNVARLTPVLKEAFGGDKNYSAENEAKRYAEAFALLKEDIGPNISATSFAKMSENTIRSAVDAAKANGTQLTEEGLRKAFFGNAVIETKMVTGNKEMYMAKNNKGKFTLPSAPYQTALGTALETYRKQGIDLGEASNAIENKFNKLPAETKKKFTQMSAGAPGSTPMLLWLQQTGGAD